MSDASCVWWILWLFDKGFCGLTYLFKYGIDLLEFRFVCGFLNLVGLDGFVITLCVEWIWLL